MLKVIQTYTNDWLEIPKQKLFKHIQMIDLKYQSKSNSNIYKWLTWNTKAKVIQTHTNDWLEIPKQK